MSPSTSDRNEGRNAPATGEAAATNAIGPARLIGTAMSVPTAIERPRESKRLRLDEDPEELRRRDPFLYYSVARAWEPPAARLESEGPAPTAAGGEGEVVVRRSRRISFECHPDLLLGDLLGGRPGGVDAEVEDPRDTEPEGDEDSLDLGRDEDTDGPSGPLAGGRRLRVGFEKACLEKTQ